MTKTRHWGTQLHAALYRITGGRVLGRVGGQPVLLLETVGRRTAQRRTTSVPRAKRDATCPSSHSPRRMAKRMAQSTLDTRSVAAGATVAAVGALLRAWYLRWGATDDEVTMALPGDELVPGADLSATRAITVRADADAVWPWIAQLGQGRGGFYSYDALENLLGCDIHSAGRIVPGWQGVDVGAEVKLHPGAAGLTAAVVLPGRALVLRGGMPIGLPPSPYDFTWAFVLHGQPDGTTRLVVRERYGYSRRWAWLLVEPVEVISFAMSQRMLRGIKKRAEGAIVSGPTIPAAAR